jgi:arginine N-succinyltransferase
MSSTKLGGRVLEPLMFVLRAVQPGDLSALMVLAGKVGSGMTTFKPDLKTLTQRIDLAVRSFKSDIPADQADYLFVLEETTSHSVVGISALKAQVGLQDAFYNFRLGHQVHACRKLGIYSNKLTLFLSNDLTGCAELCSLYLDPQYRSGENGRLLSKARLLFAASNLRQLPAQVIAELRGFQREDGTSPFWESLGRHFFQMSFEEADDICGTGAKSFIAQLMPPYPVYVDFLSEEAQRAVGAVHPNSKPAYRLLEQEGFSYQGYVDIFDAGPVLQARTSELRLVRESRLVHASRAVHSSHESSQPASTLLVASTPAAGFRAIVVEGQIGSADTLALSPEQLDALHVQDGDGVRVALLNPVLTSEVATKA